MIRKKMYLMFFLLMLVFLTANAQRNGSNIFGLINNATVADALILRDDTPVRMIGRIERRVRSEYYIFSDNTGEITVEIPPRVWGSLSISSDDLVEINGIIDRHLFRRNRVYVINIRIFVDE